MNHNSNSLKVFHLSGKVWHEYLLSPFLWFLIISFCTLWALNSFFFNA
jgi:hypothetical protein